MQPSRLLLTLSLGSVIHGASAAPNTAPLLHSSREVCGPNSNCEIFNNNGIKSYRFKSGHEPGTESYAKRMTKRKRDDDENKTYVTTGDTRIDVGCDESIAANFDLLWDLCPESGGKCDAGSEGTNEIWWTGGKNPEKRDIKVTASGTYQDKEARDNLIWAIKATINEDTIDQTERKWTGTNPGGAPGLNQGKCLMNRFSNFVGVSVFDSDGDLKSEIEAKLEMDEDGAGSCETMAKAGAAITGAISGIGGAFFGVIEMACGAINE